MTDEQTDAEAQSIQPALDGRFGAEAQFDAIQARTKEIIGLRFDLHSMMGSKDVRVNGGGEQPFIYVP